MQDENERVWEPEAACPGLAGAAGFEPANAGTKNRCLTTWLRPSRRARIAGGARLILRQTHEGRGEVTILPFVE